MVTQYPAGVDALTLSLSAAARVATCNILSSSMSDNSSWKLIPKFSLTDIKKKKTIVTIRSPSRLYTLFHFISILIILSF